MSLRTRGGLKRVVLTSLNRPTMREIEGGTAPSSV